MLCPAQSPIALFVEKAIFPRRLTRVDLIGGHMIRRLFCGIALGIVTLCAITPTSGKSAKLIMSWRKPGHVAAAKPYRVLALGLSEQTKVRADFEDALAAQLQATGVESIPGNTVLLRPQGTQFDLQYLRTQVRENHIVAVVVSRLVRVDNSVT